MAKRKLCLSCNQIKHTNMFYLISYIKKDGIRSPKKTCKKCEDNKAKILRQQEYRLLSKKEYDKNRRKQSWYKEYRDKIISKPKHRKKKQQYDVIYRQLPRNLKRKRAYEKQRLLDPEYKLRKTLRNRILVALKNKYKSGLAVKDLGCSIKVLKIYLESKFYLNPETRKQMIWKNHGRKKGCWHIDHIKPLSKFDLINRKEFLEACHYTNLQPMWAEENIKKSNKFLNKE